LALNVLTVPITAKSVYQPSLIGNSNWFYLPCGLLVKYGRTLTALIGVNYQSVINLDPIGVPYTDTPYAFATQTNAVSGNVHSVSCFFPDNAHLTITTNSNNIGLFWLTIGPVASVAG